MPVKIENAASAIKARYGSFLLGPSRSDFSPARANPSLYKRECFQKSPLSSEIHRGDSQNPYFPEDTESWNRCASLSGDFHWALTPKQAEFILRLFPNNVEARIATQKEENRQWVLKHYPRMQF